MQHKVSIKLMVTVLISLFLFTGCIPGDGSNTSENLAGLFTGVWHGWIAPFSLFLSFFNHKFSIYEINNSGFWYDLGYYMAVISGFFGLSLSRGKSREK